jgi:hypothetical protein
VLSAFGCVSSHTILDGTNIGNPDVIPDMNSGVVQDFRRQDMPDLTAYLLEFSRMQGSPVCCPDSFRKLDTGEYRGGLRGCLRSGLNADGLDHRTLQGLTAHLQGRRKVLITQENQKFSQTSTTMVIAFHSSFIDL